MELVAVQISAQEFDANELTDRPIWSTCRVAETLATNPLSLFQYGMGDDMPGDVSATPVPTDLCDTNLTRNDGEMTVDEGMKLLSTAIEVFATGDAPGALVDQGFRANRTFPSGPDVKRLQRDLLLIFWLATRTAQYSVPFGNVPTGWDVIPTMAGGRLYDAPAAIRGNDGVLVGQQGYPDIRSHLLHQPYYNIAPDEKYGVDFWAPASGTVSGLTRSHDLKVVFLGLRRVPIA